MAATSKTNTDARFQVEVSRGELGAMEDTMDKTGLSTKKELFNNAITLFEWAVAEVARGRVIGSIDPETKDYDRVVMPAFRNIEVKKKMPVNGL